VTDFSYKPTLTGDLGQGVLRDALCWDGDWVDSIVMSVLAQDWRTG
jgi:hypothetical protein